MSKEYPNFRNSVEVVILHENKILIAKRSENAKVAAGAWNVPAGKVKYDETPIQALYREAKEETNLDIRLIRELKIRTLQGMDQDNAPYYRCVFTYLVEPFNDLATFKLNDEHTEYIWISKSEIKDYTSLEDELKEILLSVWD